MKQYDSDTDDGQAGVASNHRFGSNHAPESQVSGSLMLLNKLSMQVLEGVGFVLTNADIVSSSFLTPPSPEDMTGNIPQLLLCKANPLLNYGHLHRIHDERSETKDRSMT